MTLGSELCWEPRFGVCVWDEASWKFLPRKRLFPPTLGLNCLPWGVRNTACAEEAGWEKCLVLRPPLPPGEGPQGTSLNQDPETLQAGVLGVCQEVRSVPRMCLWTRMGGGVSLWDRTQHSHCECQGAWKHAQDPVLSKNPVSELHTNSV